MRTNFLLAVSIFVLFLTVNMVYGEETFLIGAAKTDITSPIAEVSTGYNNPGDHMKGMAMRLNCRAFIIQNPATEKRIVIVVNEMLQMYQSIKIGVIKNLIARGYGGFYTTENVMLTATHGHAIPSNNSWYALFNGFNGKQGFDELHYNIVVEGITNTIIKAHHNMVHGKIKFTKGTIKNAGYNRSVQSYEKNIDKDKYNTNTDETMILLKFEALDGHEIGSINWFGIHGTSLGMTNRRVHSDNKGYAAYKFEKIKGDGFIAAFGQSTLGDVTPNLPNPADITLPLLHPHELDPKITIPENAIVHGKKQLDKALELYNNIDNDPNSRVIENTIDYRHTHVDFNNITVSPEYIGKFYLPYDDINNAKTHIACVGGAVLAGNEEGAPTAFAKEGEIKNVYKYENGKWVRYDYDLNKLNTDGQDALSKFAKFLFGPFWSLAESILQTEKYKEGQQEKVIILPVGKVDDFWFIQSDIPFAPTIAPLQIFQLGDFAIVGTPFEVTTMAGRRLKETLMKTLQKTGIKNIVIMSQANAYIQYLTTREEFAEQHYEASFNYFGPFASAALRQEMDRLAIDLINDQSSNSGPEPRDLSNNQLIETDISRNGVVCDGGDFGKVLTNPKSVYNKTYDSVQVTFQGAHPRTILQLKHEGILEEYYNPDTYSFLEIQKKSGSNWITVAKDDDPYTYFDWKRTGGNISLTSEVTITWEIRDAKPGTYRILYHGLAKSNYLVLIKYRKFTGTSREFIVQ